MYADAVRAAYISAASYYVSGAMSAAANEIQDKDAIAGAMVNQLGQAYGELGNTASSYSRTAFKRANDRMKATQTGKDYMFIMSKKDKDVVLFKISKLTGKVEGEINLGRDREPIYAVDDITGQVYYRVTDKALTSYDAR
ncbi:MAG: hypothetical protein E4H26_05765 [Flavobacteriales bacterium]|nr:MAG: hypothetical protein E4H26_05765 [Flavobacteriales bacterium]